MIRHRQQANAENWSFPPEDGWTVDQVKDLELPFDWELVDGVIVARGQTRFWHNDVRDGLLEALKAQRVHPLRVTSEQCILVDEYNTPKPDIIVFDPTGLDYFELECVPLDKLSLVIEVVSPGSRQDDRVRKPALFATSKVPCYWRVELEQDRRIAVHEYWLHRERGEYIPAPMHPVHHDKLITDVPFHVEIDLDSLVGF